jgi:hypothetical protein
LLEEAQNGIEHAKAFLEAVENSEVKSVAIQGMIDSTKKAS